MIKIVSGISVPIGSTIALVRLCNEMNRRGHDCVLYGPDAWHLDQCRSGRISAFDPRPGDKVIVHHIPLFSTADIYGMEDKIEALRRETRLGALKNIVLRYLSRTKKDPDLMLILSCQERERFSLWRGRRALFDRIHYAHASQSDDRGVGRNAFVCPNFVAPLVPAAAKPEKTAGVVGTIRKENHTHEAVKAAFQDGMETVTLYGYLMDPLYYYQQLLPLVKKYPGRIKFAGCLDDPQRIYDSLSDVYRTVDRPWSSVRRECALTNTLYHGPDGNRDEPSMSNDQIYGVWKRELGL